MTQEEKVQDCSNKQKGVGAVMAVLILIAAGVITMGKGATKWGIVGVIAAIIAGVFWKGDAYKTLTEDCTKA